jgi:hypothetical protein
MIGEEVAAWDDDDDEMFSQIDFCVLWDILKMNAGRIFISTLPSLLWWL